MSKTYDGWYARFANSDMDFYIMGARNYQDACRRAKEAAKNANTTVVSVGFGQPN